MPTFRIIKYHDQNENVNVRFGTELQKTCDPKCVLHCHLQFSSTTPEKSMTYLVVNSNEYKTIHQHV